MCLWWGVDQTPLYSDVTANTWKVCHQMQPITRSLQASTRQIWEFLRLFFIDHKEQNRRPISRRYRQHYRNGLKEVGGLETLAECVDLIAALSHYNATKLRRIQKTPEISPFWTRIRLAVRKFRFVVTLQRPRDKQTSQSKPEVYAHCK